MPVFDLGAATTARGDTGQPAPGPSRRGAHFPRAWWNAGNRGGFDGTDPWPRVARLVAESRPGLFDWAEAGRA